MAEGEGPRSLEFTPTWAVAAVCSIFVVFSLLLVLGIEKIEHKLKDAHRKPLVQAIEKIKEELMLLGFVSLLLTVFQEYLLKICIKTSILDDWTPCRVGERPEGEPKDKGADRRLLSYNTWPVMDWGNEPLFHGRILAGGGSGANYCKTGHEPIVSAAGLGQLHIFIFVLACVHVVYSLVAMVLSSLKVNRWKDWEEEAHKDKQNSLAELMRTLTLNRQTTFVKYHTSKRWSRNQIAVWAVCFFRQFGESVTRADYLTLRGGFITNHHPGKKFNFHSYIVRSMEDEFKKIVGISASLWVFVVLFLLFNIHGTNLYFWLCLVPVVVVLAVGAKLQNIIANLALEHAGITQGGHFAGQSLKPRDELFWFSKPQLVLWLIHFVLFQNAFELATFLWFRWQFGLHSCLLTNKAMVYIRIALGVAVQILCSYSTLPLYAIVTQMGTSYKQAIFQHHVQAKLHNWRKGAKKRARLGTLSEEGSSYFEDSTQDRSAHGGALDDSSRPTTPELVRTINRPDGVPLPILNFGRVDAHAYEKPYRIRSPTLQDRTYLEGSTTLQPQEENGLFSPAFDRQSARFQRLPTLA